MSAQGPTRSLTKAAVLLQNILASVENIRILSNATTVGQQPTVSTRGWNIAFDNVVYTPAWSCSWRCHASVLSGGEMHPYVTVQCVLLFCKSHYVQAKTPPLQFPTRLSWALIGYHPIAVSKVYTHFSAVHKYLQTHTI